MSLPPIVVMGVSGCGKSTVAEALAARVSGGEFLDADAYHPAANVARMAAGHALTDVDRAPWLTAVGRAMGESGSQGRTPFMACSALRRAYRMRILAEEPSAFFVLLDVSHAELARRLHERRGHYMPASLLGSQLATLEPLGADEPGIAVPIRGPKDQVVPAVLAAILARR